MRAGRPWTHVLWLSLAVVLLLGTACTRGKKRQQAEGHATPSTASDAPAKPEPKKPAADSAWERGELPAAVNRGTPRDGGEATIVVMQEPPSLNVITDSDLMANRLTLHHIYETLVGVDPHDDPRYRIVPELAERWEISDDKLTYTFHLRRGVRFHDGKPLTSRDVIATLDKVMDETTKAAHERAYFAELQGYSAPDDYTVVFRWKRPYFLVLDTLSELPIQPAHVIGGLTGAQYNEAATNPINRRPIGTGPYRMEAWEANQKIVLQRNEAYWGQRPHLDRLVVRFVKDATVRYQLVERGEGDLITRLETEHWSRLNAPGIVAKYHRVKHYDAGYAWVGWNQNSKPFLADRRVRTALTMLTDRQGMAEKFFGGLPRPTTCHFYFAGPDCDPELTPLPFDPEGAQALLAQAGFTDHDGDGIRDRDGVPLSFTFLSPSNSETGEIISTKLKEDLSRAGIEMAIQKVQWSTFIKRLRKHEFDACYLGWGGAARQDPTQIWHSGQRDGGSNFVGFESAEADRLIEEARVTLDADERSAMYRKLGAILHHEQPYTWLWVPPELAVVSKRLRGAKPSLYWWQFEDFWLSDGGH